MLKASKTSRKHFFSRKKSRQLDIVQGGIWILLVNVRNKHWLVSDLTKFTGVPLNKGNKYRKKKPKNNVYHLKHHYKTKNKGGLLDIYSSNSRWTYSNSSTFHSREVFKAWETQKQLCLPLEIHQQKKSK